jgi:hypothetical protein
MSAGTGWLTRKVKNRWLARGTITAAAAYPFACVVWMAMLFVGQWVINEAFFDRDPGLGDSWYCPLPNGYSLLFTDVTYQGIVYNPKTQSGRDVISRDDAVFGVRRMQIQNQWIFGEGNTGHVEETSKTINLYFALDTRTGTKTEYPNSDALRQAIIKAGAQPNLEPVYDVYARYRLTWFDGLVLALILIPPSLGLVLLGIWIWMLRRGAEPVSGLLARIPKIGARLQNVWTG